MNQQFGVDIVIVFSGMDNDLISEWTYDNYPELRYRNPKYINQSAQKTTITQEMADNKEIQCELQINIKNDVQLREPGLIEFKQAADFIRLCTRRYATHTISINPSMLYPKDSIYKYLAFIYSLNQIFNDLVYISDNMDVEYYKKMNDSATRQQCVDFFSRYVIEYQKNNQSQV